MLGGASDEPIDSVVMKELNHVRERFGERKRLVEIKRMLVSEFGLFDGASIAVPFLPAFPAIGGGAAVPDANDRALVVQVAHFGDDEGTAHTAVPAVGGDGARIGDEFQVRHDFLVD